MTQKRILNPDPALTGRETGLIYFDDFPRFWTPRTEKLRGGAKDWPNKWYDYPVRTVEQANDGSGKAHQILVRSAVFELSEGSILVVDEKAREEGKFFFSIHKLRKC